MGDLLRIIIITGLVWWAFFREDKITNILTVLVLGIASLISLDTMMNYHGLKVRGLGFVLYGTFVIFFIETLIYIYSIFKKAIKKEYKYILKKITNFIMLLMATVFIYYIVREIAIEEFDVDIFISLKYSIKGLIVALCVILFITHYLLISTVDTTSKRDATGDESQTIRTKVREEQKKVITSTKNIFDNPVNKNQIIFDPNISYKQLYRNIPMHLESKYIDRFYHFTAIENLESIIENGGLYSWSSVQKKNINSIMSSNELSRQLDTRKGLQDFVRLSFVEKHPMKYIVEKEQGLNLILLEIDVSVACWESTLFSDINATDNSVTIGDDLDFLKRLNYKLFKQKYINLEYQEKKKYQAEILVKEFLPIKYIKNIDMLKEKYLDYEEIPF